MNNKETIKELKDKLYNQYGILFKEDDPAWIMLLIYNDLLNNTLEVVSKFDENKISTENIEKFGAVLENINTLQIESAEAVETAREKAAELNKELSDKHTQIIDDIDSKITTLNEDVNNTIQNTINGIKIDTGSLSKIIDKKIEAFDIDAMEKFIKAVNTSVATHTTNYNAAIKLLNDGAEAVNNSSQNFTINIANLKETTETLDKKIASLGWGRFFAGILLGSIVAGALTYINAHTIYNGMFQEKEKATLIKLEDDRQMLLEETADLDAEYGKTAESIKVFMKYGISIHDQDGKKYVKVKTIYGKKGLSYNPSNEYSFIQVDTY